MGLRPDATRAKTSRFQPQRRSRRTRCTDRDLDTRVKKSHWPQLADAAGATHTRRRAKRFPSLPLRRKRRGNTSAHACALILSLVTISHGIKKKDPLKENSSRGHFYIHYGFKISGLSRVEGGIRVSFLMRKALEGAQTRKKTINKQNNQTQRTTVAHVRATSQCHQGVVAASTDDGWGCDPTRRARRLRAPRSPPRRVARAGRAAETATSTRVSKNPTAPS